MDHYTSKRQLDMAEIVLIKQVLRSSLPKAVRIAAICRRYCDRFVETAPWLNFLLLIECNHFVGICQLKSTRQPMLNVLNLGKKDPLRRVQCL